MIISLCSGIIILGSMYIGVIMLQFLPQAAAKMVGAFILMGIGVWAIIQMTLQKNNDPVDDKILSEKRIIHIEIKSLGLVIDILRTPSKADVDRSGNISASEATLLGIALSLDAFGAGIGAALIGFSPLITSLAIAVSSGVFLTLGLRAGYLFSNVGWVRRFSVLPGFILILMGVVKLFGV
jgi:putative sporulation protein YtaF